MAEPVPLRPERRSERALERLLRELLLAPLAAELAEAVRASPGSPAAAVLAAELAFPEGPLRRALERRFAEDAARHRLRLARIFSRAFSVDIRPVLLEPPVRAALLARVDENVALLRRVPERARRLLADGLGGLLAEAPFDERRAARIVRESLEGAVAASARRIRLVARDQTSKLVGQLTEIRERQAGVEEYSWSTSLDERVRPAHRANEGRTFRWDSPPPATGHPGSDVNCRCAAVAILPPRTLAALRGPPVL